MDAVRDELDDLVGVDAINQGGLKIYTTIDLHLQQLASDAVEDQLANIERTKGYGHLTREQYRTAIDSPNEKTKAEASPEYLQGALLAVDNRTGAIMALVGGRNFEESRYNRALLARRQIGSTFKPFVYAAAFGQGMQPNFAGGRFAAPSGRGQRTDRAIGSRPTRTRISSASNRRTSA